MKNTPATIPFYNTVIPNDWNNPEFGEVFSFIKTFSFSREQLTSEKTTDEIRNIHYGDIHATYENEILDFKIEKTVPYLIDGLIDKNNFEKDEFPALKDGDLIIADASEDYKGVCDCVELKNLNGSKVVGGLHTFAARANDKKIALGFRTYVLNHQQVIRELRRIATGTSVYGVSKTNLSKVKIALPPISEQKAVANLLGLMDTAININNLLILKTELKKKWLIQNLLFGKKRLKRFQRTSSFHKSDFGLKVPKDWKIVSIENIFKERNERSSDQSKYPLYSLTIEKGVTEKTDRYERSFLLKDQENNQYKVVYPNDILFNPMNLRFGAIAKSELKFPVLVSAYYNAITKSTELTNINYFERLFKTQTYNNFYERIAIGSLNEKKRVHLSNFFKLQVPLPSIEEQTAISEVLQVADNEIQILKTKSEKLKEQKKGLMQQLLTGKKRLKINHT